jgi:hypothetical protein
MVGYFLCIRYLSNRQKYFGKFVRWVGRQKYFSIFNCLPKHPNHKKWYAFSFFPSNRNMLTRKNPSFIISSFWFQNHIWSHLIFLKSIIVLFNQENKGMGDGGWGWIIFSVLQNSNRFSKSWIGNIANCLPIWFNQYEYSLILNLYKD